MKKAFFTVFVLLFLIFGLWSQEEVDVSYEIDWVKGEVTFDFTADFLSGMPLPANRFKVETRITGEAVALMPGILAEIPFDSQMSLGDLLLGRGDYNDLFEISSSLTQESTQFSPDGTRLFVSYRISLFPMVSRLTMMNHEPDPVPYAIGYIPTAEFSGLIIYAPGVLPLKGTGRETALKPALFPKVYTESGDLLLEASMVDKGTLDKWGVAGYSHDLSDSDYFSRIGDRPLVTSALGVYGRNECDLIISDEAAQKLMALEHNREMLSEGRVMIIFSAEPVQ